MSRPRIGLPARAVVLLFSLASAQLACGTPQVGGPRRTASDDDDGGTGAGVPTTCAELTCEEPATCVEQVVSGRTRALCSCPRGFRVDNNGCVDIDECADPDANECDVNGLCENRLGSYGCRCKAGFALDGNACKRLDTCAGADNTCHPAAACSFDATGGTVCSCGPDYEGDGRACTDIDECAANTATCAENAHCSNARDGYNCACDTLFTGDGKVQCRDRCEAAQADPARCDPAGHGRCVIDPTGNATCTSCTSEYAGDGRQCRSDAECGALRCGTNSVCSDASGVRECGCAPGFEGDPLQACEDVNECTTGTADCDPNTSRCLNVAGSYVCECKPGFERQGSACVNVDECRHELHRCDPNADCVDKLPGYSCECRPGYQLQPDGLSCADIDECENGTATCRKDDRSVECVNTRGSYDCRCPSGYAGNGTSETCYCDLSGAWAVRQDAMLVLPERAAAGQVLVAKSVTYASIWELHRYRYDGAKIVVERKTCGSDVAAELYSPLYNETYSSSTPNMVQDRLPFQPGVDIPLPKALALPGMTFTTPRSAIVHGIRLDDPLNDPWPERSAAVPESRWVDTDDDGEPGLSLWPGSTRAVAMTGNGATLSYLPVALQEGTTIIDRRLGCASVALRTTGATRVNIDRCDLLTGTLLETKAEGRVRSCSVLRMSDWNTTEVSCNTKDWKDAHRCAEEEVEFLDEQDQTNMIAASFEMQKLPGVDAPAIDCAAVRAKLPAIVRGR